MSSFFHKHKLLCMVKDDILHYIFPSEYTRCYNWLYLLDGQGIYSQTLALCVFLRPFSYPVRACPNLLPDLWTGLMIQVLFSHMYLTVFTKSEKSQGQFLLCCCCCLSAVPVASGKERRRCDINGTDSRRFQHRSSLVETECGFYGIREMKLLHEHWDSP